MPKLNKALLDKFTRQRQAERYKYRIAQMSVVKPADRLYDIALKTKSKRGRAGKIVYKAVTFNQFLAAVRREDVDKYELIPLHK